jgi:DNA polymerase-3 subunit gamma/tau
MVFTNGENRNMKDTLANKYRPKNFDEVLGQTTTVTILKRQLELKEFKNCYLFCGPSGTGKTTLARIFANEINQYKGSPIEIDGASNNGVDNIREIIASANERSLDSQYKIYIIDEAHMITIQGWNAFLKCIEEPPMYTIFIFCTTNPEKIPITILNRVQKFYLNRLDNSLIEQKLKLVCQIEKASNYDEACSYIAKISSGGMRTALANLDKCLAYSSNLTLDNVKEVLGLFMLDSFFNLTNAILDKNEATILETMDSYYKQGLDYNLFIDQYLSFVIDLANYCIFKNIKLIQIPSSMEKDVIYVTGADQGNNVAYFNNLISHIINIKTTIKYDSCINTTVVAMFLELCK